MKKCPQTVSGNHIWGSEITTYTIISRNELQPNVILKCKACGLYYDVNVPTDYKPSTPIEREVK